MGAFPTGVCMSQYEDLRKQMADLVNKSAELPRPSERDAILWDTLHYIAKKLDIELVETNG